VVLETAFCSAVLFFLFGVIGMKRSTHSFLLIFATIAYLGACSGSGGNDTTSSSDIGSSDTGSSDVGSSDTGSSDIGSSDIGSTDIGSSDTGSTDAGAAGSTAAIAGLWEIPADSTFNFDIAEISPNGVWTTWVEDTVDNCYTFNDEPLENKGNDNYQISLSEGTFLVYTFVNQGNSLRFTFPTLGADESWPTLEGVNTSDFNLCS